MKVNNELRPSLVTQLECAILMAVRVHFGQRDKGGNAYILHPLYVMSRFRDVKLKILSVLHDVKEDAKIDMDDIISNLTGDFFEPDILESLNLLTHKKGMSYKDYIENLSKNKRAKAVKIEDLLHNSDISRLKKEDREKSVGNLMKYKKALQYLTK